MSENTFLIPSWQNGCIEEMVIINETNDLLKYSFSNNLDSIKNAIFSRTGHNIDLENATWVLNKNLSIDVKNIMNSYNVNYSMTIDIRDNSESLVVNMRVGDKWFIAGCDKIDNKFYDWGFMKMINLSYGLLQEIGDRLMKEPD